MTRLLRIVTGSLLLAMTCSLSAAELMSHRVVGQKDFDRSNFAGADDSRGQALGKFGALRAVESQSLRLAKHEA